nr:N-acetyl-gamma-glutamyl-phosphate reductase [Priestia koreensis]
MEKKINVGIIGATGYGGVELIRLLENHPAFHVKEVYSSSQEGEELSNSYPHLVHKNLVLKSIDPIEIKKEVNLVFTSTPSGVSSKLIPSLIDAGIKVVDLSGDFRLKDKALYEKWYKKEGADADYLSKATYGLSEWFQEEIQNSDFVSNPGCYPTATLLGLAPLMVEGIVDEASIIVDGKSGVSGAGRSHSALTHFSEMNENLKIYKVNEHQHIPEIEQTLSCWSDQVKPITFSTHLVPMTRGIMTTIYATIKEDCEIEHIHKQFTKHYEYCKFVRVREKGTYPFTKDVVGSNYCDIGIAYDERTRRITVVSVIDNLVKGAAGQAIQNANLMMGLEEDAGLKIVPVYP